MADPAALRAEARALRLHAAQLDREAGELEDPAGVAWSRAAARWVEREVAQRIQDKIFRQRATVTVDYCRRYLVEAQPGDPEATD